MNENKWISFTDAPEENVPPKVEVSKSSKNIVTRDMCDAGTRTVLTVRYSTSGAWEGTVNEFQQIEIPETTLLETEGAPAVPKAGIFVAVPMDADAVEVRVVDKSSMTVEHELSIAPAPKQFIEEEFQEVYDADPKIYGSDEFYPGLDVDFLGLKTISGVKVAHILAYLGQYRPVSKQMELIESMVIEVSYQTPPAADRKPGRKPREMPEADLILGLDLLDDQTDYSSIIEDFAGLDRELVEELEVDAESSLSAPRGISLLEQNEDDVSDPAATLVPRTSTPISISPITVPVLLRPTLKVSGLIAEYVIVTPRALKDAVEPLLNAKTGWPFYAKVALTEDIQTEFPSANLKTSIKAFITWATDNWRVPPRFIVLAGDSDIIPMHTYSRGGRTYASDHFYADIAGNLIPELTVSRIPTSNATEMKSVCEHLVRYESVRRGDWGGWQNRVMLSAYQSSTYETTCDQIYNQIKNRYSTVKRYAKNTSKSDVVKTINDGVVMALYRGHGSKTAWSASNGINSTDVAGLTNGSRPPFVLNICCQNGWVDDNSLETIVEAFVRKRKAVAVFASSRNSWTYPNNDFAKYMFDAVMSGKCQTPAAIIRYAKTKMVQNHGTSSYHLDNTVMYNLFGDPTADVASNAEWLRGDWAMDHDGWKGTLKVTRIWNYHIETSNGYKAPVWNISGTYVSSANKSYPFSGTLGGFDPNQLGTGSKRSDHKVEFKINFGTSNNQKFVGYVHTWTLNRLSGLTWWSNHPFGWTAQKL
ncbi:C25 family cysteine peptidase [Desulfobacter curvatus]|uniref:C25 family cysteine peptidase n=1 Tax=Desulfobacter curvatus TaxID=2290 RepID=UPI000363454D|nr:C25 family cysteine peptidase [Desulfobacter curvatus]